MRVLALDVGDRRIGMALSDPHGILASALGAVERRGLARDLQALLAAVKEHEVDRIIVGLPKRLDGTIGEQAQKVEEFAGKLREVCDVPVEFWDERLSTFTAHEKLRQAGPRRVTRGRVDAAAAAVILQGYLDGLPRGDRNPS